MDFHDGLHIEAAPAHYLRSEYKLKVTHRDRTGNETWNGSVSTFDKYCAFSLLPAIWHIFLIIRKISFITLKSTNVVMVQL